jgi:hypothetical protein
MQGTWKVIHVNPMSTHVVLILSNGETLKLSPSHKISIQRKRMGELCFDQIEVEAKDTRVGDRWMLTSDEIIVGFDE